jgi:hypothetical protein
MRITGAVSFGVFEIGCERSQPIAAVYLPAGLLALALASFCCTRHLAVQPPPRTLADSVSKVRQTDLSGLGS